VIVRGEEAVRATRPPATCHAQLEQREELRSLLVIAEDCPAEVRMGGHVVQAARHVDAGRTRHVHDGRPVYCAENAA
jgi:hypothetical protein